VTGPFSLDEVVQLIKLDRILPSTIMWSEAAPARKLARDLPELEGPPWPGPCGGASQIVWNTFHEERGRGPIFFGEETKLKVKAAPGETSGKIYASLLPDSGLDSSVDAYEVCLALQTPRSVVDATETYAGLVLGSLDEGAYAFVIDADAQVAVLRLRPVVALFAWRHLDAVKAGPGAINILHVTVEGNSATPYLNGVKLDMPPIKLQAQRNRIGFLSHSEKARSDAWKFLWEAATQAH